MLTTEQKEFYEKNGFLKLENLFETQEIEELCLEYETLFKVRFSLIIWA